MKRLQNLLGDVAKCFGDFVQGGCVASLCHRRDVRMGIAAGILLREHFAACGALRVEVLCVVFICYWKWAPARILHYVLRHRGELLAADAQGRAALYERAWQEAMAIVQPKDFAVAANRREATVELVPRSKVRALGGAAAGFFTYRLVMNPAKRRTGQCEFQILMDDLRAGRLEVATELVAASFAMSGAPAASGAAYVENEVHLRAVGLWSHATHARTAFLRWLFRAEDVRRSFSERDWLLLAGMGSGLEKGIEAVGYIGYEDAVQICTLISQDLRAASGAAHELDDLICFLCLSQSDMGVIQDLELLSMAIVRRALKLELNRDHVDAMAKHFREGGCLHRPRVDSAERFILMRMWC
ncbi:unnamed protein product [Prorocentrum cordatum]|uniref:Uncharacterized protein n=1 Tax=Prorocentrum cordatum TaxID=2364126 RepID=A0ABN9WF38_9DINO|nr:unnamed protein product [Polarella glacialis]